jgi:hypothetical protein
VLLRVAILLLIAGPVEADDAPPPPVNVAPQQLETVRTAGDRVIDPDPDTQKTIIAARKPAATSTFKISLDERGAMTSTDVLKASGYDEWDEKIRSTMTDIWRFRPYELNGKPHAVCTAVTQIFKNPQAPARPSAPRKTI